MDNRIFNVNGSGLHMLMAALRLAFEQRGGPTAAGWYFDPKRGLVLVWTCSENMHRFPAPLDAEAAASMVLAWLSSKEAETVPLEGWDLDADHDGSNSKGWRVYCEDWGHVGDNYEAICAVTPAFMWHGK